MTTTLFIRNMVAYMLSIRNTGKATNQAYQSPPPAAICKWPYQVFLKLLDANDLHSHFFYLSCRAAYCDIDVVTDWIFNLVSH